MPHILSFGHSKAAKNPPEKSTSLRFQEELQARPTRAEGLDLGDWKQVIDAHMVGKAVTSYLALSHTSLEFWSCRSL